MSQRSDRVVSHVEKWVSSRPEFKALCQNNAHVYAVLKQADEQNSTVEQFLETCVHQLGRANATLVNDFLEYRMINPPAVRIGNYEYRFSPPAKAEKETAPK